ncbi:uncharacterized protein LOC116422922 isoform X1 [Sarcophilus harrisii]|uniref:uncharacterized protein LOC116422922 isoform X1 n=1 Tax=Sarcophilus harrisii TaxID=9305 RepID=UPI0013020011|nr:uncharacterized protein LOC116422922 isoform X1 [Sarcophilus harrisii]
MAGLARASHSGLLDSPVERAGGRRPARWGRGQLSSPLPFPRPKGQGQKDAGDQGIGREASAPAPALPPEHGVPEKRDAGEVPGLAQPEHRDHSRARVLGTSQPGPEPLQQGPALSEKSFFQPYLTTTARDCRYYPRKELSCPARSFHSQPPSGMLRPKRPLPPEPCAVQPIPRVPHRGALSLTRESYGPFQQSLPRVELSGPVHARRCPSLPSLQALYRTESSRYGSLKPDFV